MGKQGMRRIRAYLVIDDSGEVVHDFGAVDRTIVLLRSRRQWVAQDVPIVYSIQRIHETFDCDIGGG